MTYGHFWALALAFVAGCWTWLPTPGHACGGLFCNSAQPVNQAAERIIFSHNPDGTVTAVIEVQYDGPSESFSWVLPVPGVPDLAVSSTSAFDRLQAATNPQYILQTTFAPGCPPPPFAIDAGSFSEDAGSEVGGGSVVVLASGTVGPYNYDIISLDPQVAEPAAAALEWLEDNAYDVTALAPDVLGPYLADGLNLMAFKLTKDSDAGSIRPIVIRYESTRSFIPIRPTAVAANDDMGVMVWVLGEARAVPMNYKSLELNEALINWFNPGPTYDLVVTAAADEAQGHGFVTELAGSTELLEDTVVRAWERTEWERLSSGNADPFELIIETANAYGTWDGYATALQDGLTLPAGVSFGEFTSCPGCYADDPALALDVDGFLAALETDVVAPMLSTQELLGSRPYVTRMYTTLSAHEMTMDPMFAENPDLDDVDNVHMAEQEVACDGSFSVRLPQGDVVYGSQRGVWPIELGGDHPATRKILQHATQGNGVVLIDNSELISGLLAPESRGDGGVAPRDGGAGAGGGARGDAGGDLDAGTAGGSDDGCDCSVAGAGRAHGARAGLFALLIGWLWCRRRAPRGCSR